MLRRLRHTPAFTVVTAATATAFNTNTNNNNTNLCRSNTMNCIKKNNTSDFLFAWGLKQQQQRFYCTATTAKGMNDDESSTTGTKESFDPYRIIGVKPGASAHDLRVAYHDKLKQYHPQFAADGIGDITKLAEVEKAHSYINDAPTLDRRFRNLVDYKQKVWLKYLPEWMARNLEEKPRWFSFFKWRAESGPFMFTVCIGALMIGRAIYMDWTLAAVMLAAGLFDWIFGATLALFVAPVCWICYFAAVAPGDRDSGWWQSPRGFLRRDFGY